MWTWTAIDADSELCVSYLVELREADYARVFIADVDDRIDSRIQLTSGGLKVDVEAVEAAFGGDIDYAQLVKIYGAERSGEARYSPAVCTGCRKERRQGQPNYFHVSTSFVDLLEREERLTGGRLTDYLPAAESK